MTLTDIKKAVGSIKNLPAHERMEVSEMVLDELKIDRYGDQLCEELAAGKFDAMIAEADAAYDRGEALDRFC